MSNRDKDYTDNELVSNGSFRRVVKGTASPAEIEKWERWLKASDQNKMKAKRAIPRIVGFEFAAPEVQDIEAKWAELYPKTIGSKKSRSIRRSASEEKLRWIFRAVAILMLVSLVGLEIYLYNKNDEAVVQLEQVTQERTITTQEDEQKSLTFSNGSKIVLNSNSSLIYSRALPHDKTIRVTLQGEAYFKVESSPSNEQPAFHIKTPDGTIRDIGTEFVVTVEEDRSRVVLQDGLVKVETNNDGKKKIEFEVNVGEKVEFSKSAILNREVVNSTFFSSWATGSMKFEQTELRTFADYVEQRFSVDVQIVDSSLAEIKIEGAVYFKSLEGLMRSVSDAIKIPVYQSENQKTVYIGDRNENNRQ